MLDIPRMERIRLTTRPRTQRLVAMGALWPNYRFFPGVDIAFEHEERLPDHPVVFAMNHTDRFNYFPFQYRLWREKDRFTATWVKGKYYETFAVGMFMELTNNIPTVSRGYILTKDFLQTMGRRPDDAEYAAMRAVVDACANGAEPPESLALVPKEILERPRSILGREFRPARETWAEAVNAVFGTMMARFVELNRETFDKGLDLLIFPQGTRSKRLSRGHVGMSEIVLKYRKTIVPVGCSGSDVLYPGSRPWARTGRVVYRFGEPIPYEEMAPFHIAEDYEPFTPEAERKHRVAFQGLADMVMDRINGLVDPEYQFSDDLSSEGVTGTSRFI